MHPTSRIVALTAALAALTSAATAAEVRLNFDDLGLKAEAGGAPVAVPDTDGLRFSGVFGYGVGMLGSQDPDFLAAASVGKGGFLLNKQRGGAQNDIILSLVQSVATTVSAAPAAPGPAAADPAVFFQAITFNLFTKGRTELYGTDANGVESRVQGLTDGGSDFWTSIPLTTDLDDSKRFVSLRITSGFTDMALDDMVVTLSGVPGPSPVPEPAGYGLVGLALLAVGATSRRKQRG